MPETKDEGRGGRGRRVLWAALAVIAVGVGVALAYAIGLIPSCRPKPSYGATVSCVKATGGIDCTVRHTKGRAASNVCWDVTLTCRNGTRILGSSCQVVAKAGSVRKRIAAQELEDFSRCDGARDLVVSSIRAVENLD